MAQLTVGQYELTGIGTSPMLFRIDPNGNGYTILTADPIRPVLNPNGSSPIIDITEIFPNPSNPGLLYGKGMIYYNGINHLVSIPPSLLNNNKIRKLIQPVGGRRKSRRHRNRKARKSRRSRH
jgi:hypothetical protein